MKRIRNRFFLLPAIILFSLSSCNSGSRHNDQQEYNIVTAFTSAQEMISANPERRNSIADSLNRYLGSFDPAVLQGTGLIKNLIGVLQAPSVFEVSYATVYVFDIALNKSSGVTPDTLQIVRKLVLAKLKEAEALLKSGSVEMTDKEREIYTEDIGINITYLESAYARNELLGFPTPDIDFLWCSDGESKGLSDFQNKVVVLDFWATWCGPCLVTFPNLRKLQERYENYPVVFLGITSIQGYYNDAKNRQRVDTKGNPEAEMGYMSVFMKDMEMTWLVAFSEKNVFNPDFGVRLIPHIAIIDAAGIVRYNALRPDDAPYHEAEKIDALLKEAGLPFPGEPMEKTNFAK
jgi:thiol-disulfide isomerase/thioredoxin